jgi:hypothetical protein
MIGLALQLVIQLTLALARLAGMGIAIACRILTALARFFIAKIRGAGLESGHQERTGHARWWKRHRSTHSALRGRVGCGDSPSPEPTASTDTFRQTWRGPKPLRPKPWLHPLA